MSQVTLCRIDLIDTIPGAENVVIYRSGDLSSVMDANYLSIGKEVIFFPAGTQAMITSFWRDWLGESMSEKIILPRKKILGVESNGIFIKANEFYGIEDMRGKPSNRLAEYLSVINPRVAIEHKPPDTKPYAGPRFDWVRKKTFLSQYTGNNNHLLEASEGHIVMVNVGNTTQSEIWLTTPRLYRDNKAINIEGENTHQSVYGYVAARLLGLTYRCDYPTSIIGVVKPTGGFESHSMWCRYDEEFAPLRSSSGRRDLLSSLNLGRDILQDKPSLSVREAMRKKNIIVFHQHEGRVPYPVYETIETR